MSEAWIVLLVAALLLPFVYIGRRYAASFVAAHQRLPGWSDVVHRDPDPETERWRLPRLILGLLVLGALIWQFVSLLT
jgi:hypothetical protein